MATLPVRKDKNYSPTLPRRKKNLVGEDTGVNEAHEVTARGMR